MPLFLIGVAAFLSFNNLAFENSVQGLHEQIDFMVQEFRSINDKESMREFGLKYSSPHEFNFTKKEEDALLERQIAPKYKNWLIKNLLHVKTLTPLIKDGKTYIFKYPLIDREFHISQIKSPDTSLAEDATMNMTFYYSEEKGYFLQ